LGRLFRACAGISYIVESKDYSNATSAALDFARDAVIDRFVNQVGLQGVFAPAKLAAWPITHVINDIYTAVASAQFNRQSELYIIARQAGHTPAEIYDLEQLCRDPRDRRILAGARFRGIG
jgi:hypothetical protein